MKQLSKFAIALILGVVAVGFQSCVKTASEKGQEQVASQDEENPTAWEYMSLTDEFGDDNGQKVLTALFDGTFSNVATSGSDAKLQILYAEHLPIFRIFDYGTQPVKGNNFLRAKVKQENGRIDVAYLLDNEGFFVPVDIPGTLGAMGLDSLLLTEQVLKLSCVLLDGDSDIACLTTEMGYISEEAGSAPDYAEKTEANQPKYTFAINPKGLNGMLQK